MYEICCKSSKNHIATLATIQMLTYHFIHSMIISVKKYCSLVIRIPTCERLNQYFENFYMRNQRPSLDSESQSCEAESQVASMQAMYAHRVCKLVCR